MIFQKLNLEKAEPYCPFAKGKGKIKVEVEDFIVEEIDINGNILKAGKEFKCKDDVGGKWTHFVLEKWNWTTDLAIKRIAKALRISHKRFRWAGNKDKRGITTQWVSVFNVKKESLRSLNLKDIFIRGACYKKEPVRMGQLLGNRFIVKVWEESPTDIKKVCEALGGMMPNFYGPQRFGSVRGISHAIGYLLLKGQFEDAVWMFLTETKGEVNPLSIEARTRLREEGDFKKALQYFPKHLKHERLILSHLSKYPKDFVNALRKLPRGTLLLFVHAIQSFLFNVALRERLKEGELKKEEGEYYCGENSYGFPDLEKKEEKGFLVGKVIGYNTKLNEREKELLERFGIEKEEFKLKSIPEVASEGTFRPLIVPYLNFQFRKKKNSTVLRFDLPAGSYATVLLRCFYKTLSEGKS